jgi:hypothetical protein
MHLIYTSIFYSVRYFYTLSVISFKKKTKIFEKQISKKIEKKLTQKHMNFTRHVYNF